MTRGSTSGRDKDESKATLFHGGRSGPSGAAIFHSVLQYYVALFVNTVEGAQEKSSILDSHQHPPE